MPPATATATANGPDSAPPISEPSDGGPPATDFGGGDVLGQIRSLTDVGTMTRLLHECIAYQRSLDGRLDGLLAQRGDLERHLQSLHASSEVLHILTADAAHMRSSVGSTSSLADQVSGKVRELDLAQSHVHDTLARIDSAVERAACLDAARRALDADDFESAADAVRTYLRIDARFRDDGGSEQREQLLDSKKRLEGIVRRRIAAAVDQRDHAAVVRFVWLFSPLGLEDEGLQIYVSYVRKVISLRSRLEFEQLSEALGQNVGRNQVNFVTCLTNLFADIVLAVEENDEVLRGLCGEDGIVYAICELQEECDTRGSSILRTYMDFRKLASLATDITSYRKTILSVGPVEGPDPREIELYLEEILTLTQRGEEYTEFMLSKIRGLSSVNAELGPRATMAFRSGGFNRMAQELTGYYVILEEYFMVENVRKAINIDELVADSLTTSMVDDVFYVLKKCCGRAISTSNIHSVLAVLSGAVNLLSNEYQEALQQKMREPNLGAKLFLGGVGVQKTGTEIATALNNMDMSSVYVLKLRQETEEQCLQIFPSAADREKVKSCLSEMGEMSNAFKQILNIGMEQLASSVTPRIRPVLDGVGIVSYELSEDEYAENERNDPWVQKLLHAVESNVAWLQPAMTNDNYDLLVHAIIDFIVKRLEVIMMQKRFSQLGGLQLDRDVRALVNHFSGMATRTVRDKFARLTQMATILNLEKVSEILDFWGENSGPMTWRLTPAEVRRVLSLRIDFKPEAIAALRL